MIVKTLNSTYEVRRRDGRFRRVAGIARQGAPPIGLWRDFDQMGPLVAGKPMRLFSLEGDSRRLSNLKTLTTAPVVAVIDVDNPDHR